MKLTTTTCQLINDKGDWVLSATIPKNQYHLLDKLKKVTDKEGLKTIEVKAKRKGRSLSANAYCHVLIEKIAKLLTSTHNEIYEQMLHDYGVHKFPICTPKKIAGYKQDYKFVEVMNKLKVQLESGKMVDAVQLKCTKGSSKYDSLQMSQFIEGIKTECDILGIETLTDNEIATMMKGYDDANNDSR